MIKRTLYFSSPAYISSTLTQLKVKIPAVEKNLPIDLREEFITTTPIEDIGLVILDNPQITITHRAIQALAENNCAIIFCDGRSMPHSLTLPMEGNTLLGERSRNQTNASLPTKKQLWQQTVQAKIANQSALLKSCTSTVTSNMERWATEVRSNDSTNLEARAAVYYWSNLFPKELSFIRDRDGAPPNNLLNYGYSILRAIIARALVGTGLLPALGIFHSNKYNAYALADDIMEPYRPYVDSVVLAIVRSGLDFTHLSKEVKYELLSIPTLDVSINNLTRPLINAATITTSSLYKCLIKEERKILYPQMAK